MTPTPFLRAEAAAALAVTLAAYTLSAGNWWLFAALFLAPDLAMLAYFRNPRAGALAYNLAHWAPPAIALAAAGWWFVGPLATQLGLVWLAHITFDRAMGYGLKLPTAFGDTHLGRVGKGRPA